MYVMLRPVAKRGKKSEDVTTWEEHFFPIVLQFIDKAMQSIN